MLPATAIVAARSLARALVEDGLFDGPTMRRLFEQWLELEEATDGLEGFLLERGLIAPRVLRALQRAHGWAPQSSADLIPTASSGSSFDPLGLEEPEVVSGASTEITPVRAPDKLQKWADRSGTWPTVPSGRWGRPVRLGDAGPAVASEAPTRRMAAPSEEPSTPQQERRDKGSGTGLLKEPRVGQVLGGYELVSELGRGGMGIVFQARRDDDARLFAVKVLRPSRSPAFKAHRVRFQREIEALRQLTHVNLIRIRARGRAGDYDWYAMDHVAGTDLNRLMLEEQPSEARRLQIFEDVCRGAAHAHDHGIVHRDLKPHNVIVEEQTGRAVLIDFGLAKIAGEDLALTRSGSLLGTPYYMSPEQIRNPQTVDARTDVWSLGVILYEMLTGQVPFPGNVPGDVCQRILHAAPVRPRKLQPTIHTDLEGILLRALEKDPARRYPSAKQFLAELVRYRRGRAVAHDGVRGRWRRWYERHREGFWIGLGVASLAWATAWGLSYVG